MVLPALGGPLLGVALGRWVRFPGAALALFLILYGWVILVTIVSLTHPDPTPNVVLSCCVVPDHRACIVGEVRHASA